MKYVKSDNSDESQGFKYFFCFFSKLTRIHKKLAKPQFLQFRVAFTILIQFPYFQIPVLDSIFKSGSNFFFPVESQKLAEML